MNGGAHFSGAYGHPYGDKSGGGKLIGGKKGKGKW